MGVKIARESDGRVSITLSKESHAHAAVLSPVEARLLAIKLLLAAEQLDEQRLS